jgi:uncharacterized protein involved in type VI secretion and phage assembly
MNTSGFFPEAIGHGTDRWYGVVPAVVIDNNDQARLGRVRIRFLQASDAPGGLWARVAVLMGGANRGTFFLPEVGDEVLVGFESGNPNKPYILGGLWSNIDQPPDTNADGKNNKRLIKSRSGHLIRLDDTDGSEKIEIIDRSGKNSMIFDTANNAITISSAQDVNINAPQGTITLSAKTISISASGDSKIEAQSGLTVQAGGNTTIKGTMVNIN